VVKPAPPDKPELEWSIIIGFSEADWEFDSADEWWMECWIPEPVFDELAST